MTAPEKEGREGRVYRAAAKVVENACLGKKLDPEGFRVEDSLIYDLCAALEGKDGFLGQDYASERCPECEDGQVVEALVRDEALMDRAVVEVIRDQYGEHWGDVPDDPTAVPLNKGMVERSARSALESSIRALSAALAAYRESK